MASRKAKTSAMMEDEEFVSFDLFRTEGSIHNRRSNGRTSRAGKHQAVTFGHFEAVAAGQFAIDLSKLREGKHIAPWLIERPCT